MSFVVVAAGFLLVSGMRFGWVVPACDCTCVV